jgi:hypothetical protein
MAVVIVGLSLGVLMESLGRCLAASRSIQNYNTAQILLANKSCEFRLEHSTDTLDQNGDFPGFDGFTWSRDFTVTDTEGLWKQTITVAWQERGKPVTDTVVEYRRLPHKQKR